MKLHGKPLAEDFDTRTIRIFDAGHMYEDYVIKLMTFGGAKILSRQQEYREFEIFAGHSDVVIDYEGPAIIDVKTMNQKRAWEFAKADLQEGFLDYFIQVNLYMSYQGTRNGLLLAYNKNTSEITARRVEYNQERIDFYKRKAAWIVAAGTFSEVPDEFSEYKRSQVLAQEDVCCTCPARTTCYGP